MIAAIRPDSWNWLLFFHLLFAFVLIGGAITVVVTSFAAGRRAWPTQTPLLRAIAFRTNLVVVLPALIGVRVFGELLSNREYDENEPGWLEASFGLTDLVLVVGGVLLTLLQFWVLRRVRAGKAGGWPAQLATFLPPAVLAVLVAVIVMMAGKPGS
jgi:hypothetical protein